MTQKGRVQKEIAIVGNINKNLKQFKTKGITPKTGWFCLVIIISGFDKCNLLGVTSIRKPFNETEPCSSLDSNPQALKLQHSPVIESCGISIILDFKYF